MMRLPYPGLRPFRRDESDIFFGREVQVDDLLCRLSGESRFLAVIGPSGCGKSSLVRAGLINALEAGFLSDAGSRWRVAEMRPGARPLGHLADALCADHALGPERAGDRLTSQFLRATLSRGPLGLIEALSETPLPERVNLLLLADQFEEIFRYRSEGDPDEADAFVSLLLATAHHPGERVYVVLTMRSDFLGECTIFPGLPEAMNEAQFLTPRLTRSQQRAAIEGPARLVDATVEPALVSHLLNDMGPDPDQLPLMQHALMRVWTQASMLSTSAEVPLLGEEVDEPAPEPEETPRQPLTLTLDDYRAVGGLHDALSNHADKVFDELSADQQSIAETVFRRLTERGEARRDLRRPTPLDELARVAGTSETEVARVVDEFRRPGRSFLTPPFPFELGSKTMVDISHEALIRQWDRLDKWADAEAALARNYRYLRETARRWRANRTGSPDESDIRSSDLWRGHTLESALDWWIPERPTPAWAARYGAGFELAERFLDASLASRRRERAAKRELEQQQLTQAQDFAAERARSKLKGRVNSALIFAALVLLAALLIAGRLWYLAKAQSEEEDFTREARQILAQHPLESLTKSIQAYEKHPLRSWIPGVPLDSPFGEMALRTTLAHLPLFKDISEGHDGVQALFSPAGGWLVTLAARHVRVRNAEDLSLHVEVPLADSGAEVLVAPNDRWLAVRDGGEVRLWNLFDPGPEPSLLVNSGSVTAMAFGPVPSSNGQHAQSRLALDKAGTYARLAVGEEGGLVRVWELDGSSIDSLSGIVQPGPVTAITLDGNWLATVCCDGAARVWDLAADPTSADPIAYGVKSLVLDPLGRNLVTAGGKSKLWRLPSAGQDLISWDTSRPELVKFSDDGRWLAVGVERALYLYRWDTTVSGFKPAPTRHHAARLRQLEFGRSAPGYGTRTRTLVTVSDEGPARLWAVEGEATTPLPSLPYHRARSVSLGRNSEKAVTVGTEGTIRLWDLASTLAAPCHKHFPAGVSRLLVSPGGGFLAILVAKEVHLFGIQEIASGCEPLTVLSWDTWISDAAFVSDSKSADSRWLVAASYDGSARAWDLEALDAKPVALAMPPGPTSVTGLAAAGAQLAARRSDQIVVWRTGPLDEQPELLEPGNEVTAIAFGGPAGRTLISSTYEGSTQSWDVETGEKLEAAREPLHIWRTFAAGTRRLAAGSRATAEQELVIWDLDNWQRSWQTDKDHFPGDVLARASSPTGSLVATAAGDGTVLVWRVGTIGEALSKPDLTQGGPAHSKPSFEKLDVGSVQAMAFDREDRWLAMVTGRRALLWALDETTEPVSLPHRQPVTDLAFTPDGRWLVTASADNYVRFWTLDIEQIHDIACKAVGTYLTEEELRDSPRICGR